MILTDILQDISGSKTKCATTSGSTACCRETFYESYQAGEEPPDDAWVRDWTAWASAYKVWLRRREPYQAAVHAQRIKAPNYASVIERTARRESIPVPA